MLQNPYDRGKLAEGWHPSSWRRELRLSRSGCRLRVLLDSLLWKVHFTNANPGIGEGPDAALPADLSHLKRALRRVQPDAVLSCGKVAEPALCILWAGPLFVVPHPAYRVLTDALYRKALHLLERWARTSTTIPRLALRQERGSVRVEPLFTVRD